MSYFAATFVRISGDGWRGSLCALGQFGGLEDVVELMRDLAGGQEPVLLFVEENEEWFAILRVDGDGEPLIFLSDLRAPLTSEHATMIYEGIGAVAETDEEAEPARAAAGEPGGDAGLLADFDMSEDELVELCVEEGLLPGDALAGVAERLGFAEELDRLRQ